MSTAKAPGSTGARRLRTWLLVAVFLGLIVLASLALDSGPAMSPALQLDTASALVDNCEPPVLIRSDETPVNDLSSLRMNSNTFLRAYLCGPTRLRLTAEGSAVDGIGARLGIYLGDAALFDAPIIDPVALDLSTDAGGWLLITFGNDLYRPPLDRNLHLMDIDIMPLTDAGQ